MLTSQKNKNISSFMLLIFSLIFLREVNYLFYDSTLSPDYSEYFIYFDHFANQEISTNREHGLMYYYLQYINYFFQYNEFGQNQILFHKSIQQTNFYIYVFGLFGYYKLLEYLQYQKSSIFLTFTFLCYFPISMVQRIVFKPEILAFALLPWILFCIEIYKSEKRIRYLYFSLPIVAICLTLKGNILVIISVYLVATNLNLIAKLKKTHILSLLAILFILMSFLTIENSSVNNKGLLDVQSGATLDEKYNYKAPLSIIYNISLFNLVTSPIKHDHAESFIGITLLETSGDYFDLYWDSDCCNYFDSRKEFIIFEVSNKIRPPSVDFNSNQLTIFIQKDTDIYLFETLGLFMSIIFYSLLIKSLFNNSAEKRYLVAVFYGMGLLLFHSIAGFPVNNFDPNIADTFKPHYYSFVFLLSTTFLVINLITTKKKRFFLIFYVLFCFFSFGVFKSATTDLNQNLQPYVEYSSSCSLTKPLIEELYGKMNIDCGEYRKSDVNKSNNFFKTGFVLKPINFGAIIVTIISLIYLIPKKRELKT